MAINTGKIISKSGFGIVSPSTSESTYVKKLKNFDANILDVFSRYSFFLHQN